ncbi:hypothetical protein CsSME_00004155 [Camellia sinensis var. sinensis]
MLPQRNQNYRCFSSRVHLPTAVPLASRAGLTMARYDSYASLYSSSFSAQPLSSRVGSGKMAESSPTPLHQTPDSSSMSYSTVRLDYPHIAAADRQHTQPQVRFDPFTGKPYKFDPFTGEPILPESLLCHFGSPY